MKVADDRLRAVLGVTEVTSQGTRGSLAIVDNTLEAA
jgi:hypothetical protein